MRAKKKLGIGLVGCGFMGRAHSNAFGQVGKFFELEFQPVLTAACARNAASAEAFARNWGFGSFETDWRRLVARGEAAVLSSVATAKFQARLLGGGFILSARPRPDKEGLVMK